MEQPMLRIRMIAIVLSCATTLPAAVLAAPGEVPSHADPATLKLHVSSGKASYALYEPVVVSYRISNPTDLDIVSGLENMSYGRSVGLTIQGPQGDAKPFKSAGEFCYIPTVNRVFKPGETDTGQVILFFNDLAHELAFPSAGTYKLTVSAHVWNNPGPVIIQAEPLIIDVREPSDLDRRAIEALGSTDRLMTFFRKGVVGFCGDEPREACGERLRSFLRRYRESAYAPAVTYYYGLAVASSAIPVGPKDEQAAAVFATFLRRWPGHPFEPIVTLDLIRRLHDLGRHQEALELLHHYEQRFPDFGSELRELRGMIE